MVKYNYFNFINLNTYRFKEINKLEINIILQEVIKLYLKINNLFSREVNISKHKTEENLTVIRIIKQKINLI